MAENEWPRILARLLGPVGDIALPALTREDLLALSDDPVLAHAGDAAWWGALDDVARELVLQTAQHGLIARNLLTAAPGGTALLVADDVRLILQARSNPSWLVVLGEPASTDMHLTAAGIDMSDHSTSAALLAARIAGVYAHRLARSDIAVDAVVEWLLRAPIASAGPTGRTIEVITPGSAAGALRDRRAIVLGDGSGWVLSTVSADDRPGPPSVVDVALLRAWLLNAIDRTAPTGVPVHSLRSVI